MIANNAWVCPIKPEHQDKAFYSVSKDHIVVPTKEQFVDGESFYGTLLHEMTHSTGSEMRLGRLKAAVFGDSEYAREELVAELGSALICQQNGISKHVKGDSAAYLKAWLDSLEESPDFIRTVMSDVKKATAVINFRMQEVKQQLDNGQEVRPYTHEDAVLDPTLVVEAPFKETPKEETISSSSKVSEDKLLKQFEEMKRKHPDAILLFRVGDFYETYKEDAVRSSGILDIPKASRQMSDGSKIDLVGFPHHALDTYLPKLVRAGVRVAICEQLEDPKVKKEDVAAMAIPKKGMGTFREVDVMSLFGALKRDGEAKLSDHYVDDLKERERQNEAQREAEKEAERQKEDQEKKEEENRSKGFRR